MSVPDYVKRLQELNPGYKRSKGSESLRLATKAPRQSAQETTQEQEMPDPNQVANILESPLYSQNLKDYYLSTYLPGLTEATFNINQAQTTFGSNEADRARQRGEAIKRVAGNYAARGMRSPGAINEERSGIQSEFGKMTREEQNQIQSLINQRDVLYGAGAQDSETFLSNPTLFGSIGAGARRESLGNLQNLPELYNLLGLGASTAPLVNPPAARAAQPKAATTSRSTTGTRSTSRNDAMKTQINKRLTSANKARQKLKTSRKGKKNTPSSWLGGRTAF
jgi:hypothetical protein